MLMNINEAGTYQMDLVNTEANFNHFGGDHRPRIGTKNSMIDGKVLYRTTDQTASSFGSLKKTLALQDEEYQYLDSLRIPLEIIGNDVLEYSYNVHHDHDHPFEKYQDFEPSLLPRMRKFLVPLNSSLAAPPTKTHTSGEDSWDDGIFENKSTQTYTGSATEIEVTNYIEKALTEYSSDDLTFRMVFLGFGPGRRGKHVLTDDFEYIGTSGASNNFGTSSLNNPLYTKLMLSKISGFRYGISGIRPTSRTYHFSRNSYGQFKDLEMSPIDGAYEQGIPDGDYDQWIRKSPIKIIGRDPATPRLEKSLVSTKRHNKFSGAQVTAPYDDNQNDPRTITADGSISQNVSASSIDGSVTVDLVNSITLDNTRD